MHSHTTVQKMKMKLYSFINTISMIKLPLQLTSFTVKTIRQCQPKTISNNNIRAQNNWHATFI